jgi:hypothetical protein
MLKKLVNKKYTSNEKGIREYIVRKRGIEAKAIGCGSGDLAQASCSSVNGFPAKIV